MKTYIVGRLGQGAVALFLITIVVFVLSRLTGNPLELMLDATATPGDRALLAQSLGLDKSYPFQYWVFLSNLVHGDLGRSLMTRHPVLELILQRLPATLQLGAAGFVVSMVIAIPIGVLSAVRRGTWLDILGKTFAVLGQSVPVFWVGLMLMAFFSVHLGLLPVAGRGNLAHVILPAVSIGWFVSAGVMRLVRSSMLDVLGSDYVLLHKIKGLSQKSIIWKHCLKNASIPVVTYVAVMAVTSFIVGGVTIEIVFAWPGLGYLAYESVVYRDYPVIQGIVLFAAGLFVSVNLLVDILYAYLNPRIRYQKAK